MAGASCEKWTRVVGFLAYRMKMANQSQCICEQRMSCFAYCLSCLLYFFLHFHAVGVGSRWDTSASFWYSFSLPTSLLFYLLSRLFLRSLRARWCADDLHHHHHHHHHLVSSYPLSFFLFFLFFLRWFSAFICSPPSLVFSAFTRVAVHFLFPFLFFFAHPNILCVCVGPWTRRRKKKEEEEEDEEEAPQGRRLIRCRLEPFRRRRRRRRREK